jgi:hypothetical protein
VRTSFRKLVEIERLQGRNVLPGNAQYLIHCDQSEGIKSAGHIARIQNSLVLDLMDTPTNRLARLVLNVRIRFK